MSSFDHVAAASQLFASLGFQPLGVLFETHLRDVLHEVVVEVTAVLTGGFVVSYTVLVLVEPLFWGLAGLANVNPFTSEGSGAESSTRLTM